MVVLIPPPFFGVCFSGQAGTFFPLCKGHIWVWSFFFLGGGGVRCEMEEARRRDSELKIMH